MKKFFILAVVSSFITNTFAWTLTIENKSKQVASGHIVYGRLCANENFRIAPGSSQNIRTGICCVSVVKFDNFGLNVETPRTGAGMTCKNATVQVVDTQDGGIFASAL